MFLLGLLCICWQFPSTSPPGAYIWRGELTEGFLHYEFGGLIFGGAYFRTLTILFRDAVTQILNKYLTKM